MSRTIGEKIIRGLREFGEALKNRETVSKSLNFRKIKRITTSPRRLRNRHERD